MELASEDRSFTGKDAANAVNSLIAGCRLNLLDCAATPQIMDGRKSLPGVAAKAKAGNDEGKRSDTLLRKRCWR